MKNKNFKILFYVIALFFHFLISCKKPCNETWTIKGRLLNGTTLKPIKNVWFSATLYNKKENGKAKDLTYVGQGITDDSGYFTIEYLCQEKTFERFYVETLAPYSSYVYQTAEFQKHYYNTFYYSTQGRVQVFLKPKKPLNGDTLFIEFYNLPALIKRDSFVSEFNGLWLDYQTPSKGGGGHVYAARRRTLMDSLTKKINLSSYQGNGWWALHNGITGDPYIDTIMVEY